MTYTLCMAYTIEAEGLVKTFGRAPSLAGVDLQAEAGTVLALLGPNGAGKTTTVRILSTLLRADAGRARVAGHDVAREPAAVRRALSLTGQYAAVDEPLTGRENLHMLCRLRHLGRAAARRRTAELLERFDLADAADRRVATWSGGMRGRLDLAMSLASVPPVLVLDEPTTGLDPRSRRAVWDAVAALRADGVTVLLTTQYLEEADRLADRVVVLDAGRVVAEGTAERLKAAVGSETVELVLTDPLALDRARAALAGRHADADRERASLRVRTDGSPAAVRDLLVLMDAAGVTVLRLALHRPTLDDVFLTLTGRP
jgi:ABC-2 type transport system ATP-binding protein